MRPVKAALPTTLIDGTVPAKTKGTGASRNVPAGSAVTTPIGTRQRCTRDAVADEARARKEFRSAIDAV
jgi:hypothetical protein